MQSYTEFIQSNFPDRTSQKVLFDDIRRRDKRFNPETSGLNDEQAATILADVTGFEPFRRFGMGKFQQTADFLGEFTQRVGDVKLSDFGVTEATDTERNFREMSTDAGRSVAKFFGADEEMANLIGQGTGELPNIAAMFAQGALGPIGFASMLGTMYGQGVNSAANEGITGGKAVAMGVTGPAISLATIGLARPLADKAGAAVVKAFSGTAAKAGITEAAKDLAARGGSKVLQEVIESAAVPLVSKTVMKLSQEMLVETAQAAIGVGGEVASELIRDPKDFLNNKLTSKEFWIPTIVSESLEGVGGTVIGRLRNPIKTKEKPAELSTPADVTSDGNKLQADTGEAGKGTETVPKFRQEPSVAQRMAGSLKSLKPAGLQTETIYPAGVDKSTVPTPASPQEQASATASERQRLEQFARRALVDQTPIYSEEAKTAKGIDPANESSDAEVVESVEVENQIAAQKLMEVEREARSATYTQTDPLDPNKKELTPASLPNTINDGAEAVDRVARVLQAEGHIGGQQNPAIAAVRELGEVIERGNQDVPEPQRIVNAIENMYQGSDVGMKDHRIATDEGGYLAFRNPGTQESAVYVELTRTQDGKQRVVSNRALQEGVKAFTLDANELLTFARDATGEATRAELNRKAGIELTDVEFETIRRISAKVKADYDALSQEPVSFAEGYDPTYVGKMKEFLNTSGITAALVRSGQKLRFGAQARKTSVDLFKTNSFDYFSAKDRAWSKTYGQFNETYVITRHRWFTADSDLHELGHVVDRLITDGHFGEQHQREWMMFKRKVEQFAASSMTASAGAKLSIDSLMASMKESGENVTLPELEDTRQHYLKVNEVMAQTFQGYMLSGKHKWKSFVEENFPTLHQFFTKVAQMLKRQTLKQTDDALNFYSPLFREGRDLLAGMFQGQYAEMASLNKQLRRVVDKRGMTGRVLDAFNAGWYEVATPQAHEVLVKAYDKWITDNPGELTVVQEQELVDLIETMRSFNRTIGNDGLVSAEHAMWSMPWLNKLRTQSERQFLNLRDALLRVATPEESVRIMNLLGTDEGIQWVQENMNVVDKETAERVNDFMAQRQRMASLLDGMSEAVGEFLAEEGGERPKAHQVAEQLMQVDSIVRDWMLGRIEGKPGKRGRKSTEGQKGQPMYDAFAELFNTSEGLNNSATMRQMKKRHQFRVWFPILEEALRTGVKRGGKVATTDVYEDGTFEFGSETRRKKPKPLKKFSGATALQDAAEYAATLQQSADFANHYVYPDPVKAKDGKIKYFKIRVKEANQSRLPRLNAMQDEAYAVQKHAETLVELYDVANDDVNPTGTASGMYNQSLTAAEETFLRENKSMFLRKVGEVVPRMVYQGFKNGTINARMKSEMEIFNKWLDMTIGQPRMAFFSLARAIGMKENITPLTFAQKWLEVRLNGGDPKFMSHVLAEVADPSGTISNFVKSLDRYGKLMTISMLQDSAKSLDAGQLPVIDPSEQGKEGLLTNGGSMSNKQVAEGVAPVLGVTGGTAARANVAATNKRNIVSRIFGKPIKAIEGIFELIGGGPMHIIMTRPEFSWGNCLAVEVGEASGDADRATSPLWMRGKVLDDPNLDARFIVDENADLDRDSAVLKIMGNAEMDKVHNEIILLEQKAARPFEMALKHEDPLIAAEARRLLESIPSADLPVHKEALERRYAAKKAEVQNEIRSDIQFHITSFATTLNLQGHFQGRAKDAEMFAKRFRDAPSADRAAMLQQELGIADADFAQKIVESFNKVELAMQQKHLKQMQHLEHVTEKRMRNYHVSVVFKGKGVGGKPEHGYFDFDELSEAMDFIAKMKAEGHKVPDKPKDFKQAQTNYKPVTGSLAETTSRVVEERKHMIQFMLAGRLPDAQIEEITSVLDNVAGDVIAEEEAASLRKERFSTRKFVEGRENLNMLEQYITYARARSASNARRQSDMIFKLYRNDMSSLNDPKTFQLLDNFKRGIRQKDTETQKTIGKVGFTMFMGLNFSSGIIEIFQYPTTLTPMLLEQGASLKDAITIPARHWATAAKAAMTRLAGNSDDSHWTNQEHLDLIREAERQGRLHQRRHHDISETRLQDVLDRIRARHGQSSVTNQVLDKAFNFVNKSYSFFNRMNAELSLVSTYDILRKQRYGDRTSLLPNEMRDLTNDAMRLTDVANGSLQRLGRPRIFNAPDEGIRNVASAYWSLQSFANAQVLNQIRMMKKWIDSDGKFTPAERKQARKAVTTLFGFQFAGMGVMGFTLMPSISKLVEMAFGTDMEDEIKDFLYNENGMDEADRNFLGDLATGGILTAANIPIDYGTRISISGIGPLSGFEGFDPKQLGGPIVGIATSIMRDIKRAQTGDITMGEAALNLLPMGLRRGIKTQFFDDGKVYDANKKIMFEPTAAEKVGMFLGFNTLRARKEMKARTERREAADSDMRRRSKLKNEILEAFENKSIVTMQNLLQQGASEFNTTVPELARSVIDLAADRRFGQTVREGRGPSSERAVRLYPRVQEVKEVERLNFTQRMAQQMGMPIRIKPSTFQDAARRDYIRQTQPGMLMTDMNQMIENPLMRTTIDQAISPAGSLPEFLRGVGLQ